jgi:hypothetical protein
MIAELWNAFNRTVGELGHLNPILLLDELFATTINGGGVRIGWYADAAAPAVRLLRAHGVKTWGYRMAYDPDRRWCMVRRAQATWAVGLLKGAGYAICDGPDAPAIRTRSTWGVPAPAQGFVGLLANLIIGGTRRQRRSNRGR